MLNAEKYRDKLLKFIEERDAGSFTFSKGEEGYFWQCGGRRCSECGMRKERSDCSVTRLEWLLSEYKEPVELSKLEYDILKYLSDNTEYLYIARDKSGFLGVYRSEPDKLNTSWCCCNSTGHLNVFTELFQFIKLGEEKPRVIRDILENCEVINDDL